MAAAEAAPGQTSRLAQMRASGVRRKERIPALSGVARRAPVLSGKGFAPRFSVVRDPAHLQFVDATSICFGDEKLKASVSQFLTQVAANDRVHA